MRSYEIAEENLRKAYSSQLKKFLTELEQVSGENVNLTFMKDELAQPQKVLERITERLIALQTERAAPARVIWHQPAKPSPGADRGRCPTETWPWRACWPSACPLRWRSAGKAWCGESAAAEDLEQQLHLAVLGEITRLPMRGPRRFRVRPRPGSAWNCGVFQESIDSLRTALTLSDDLRNMRILAITSAVNHEGKTSVASQLALSLARATGKMTLLIDGDMRSPDVHKVFDVPQEPGLAEVLSDECPLADAIVTTHNEHVHLLPAGRLKVEPPPAAGERGLEIAPGADSRQLRLRDHRYPSRAGRQRGPGARQGRRRNPAVRDARREPRGPGAEGCRAVADCGRASRRHRAQRGPDESLHVL